MVQKKLNLSIIDSMEKKLKNLYNLLDIIIPQKFNDAKEGYKNLLKKANENPKEVIPEEVLLDGFYGINNYSNENFLTMVALDILSEGFISIIDSNFNDYLWGKLSSLLIYNDAENLRIYLTHELYENKNIAYTYRNTNRIFKNSDFILFRLKFDDLEAIGLTKKNVYKDLKKECSHLEIDIRKLNE
jgi:hypothetical protein